METQRQLAQATASLADATATAISRRQPVDNTTTAERLAVQLAELRTDAAQARDEARAPLRPSTQSTFGTRYNAFTAAPSNVQFMSPVTQAPQAPVPMIIDAPVAPPLGPQVIVIQRAAVELLNHVPTYNGESTAAAIPFIGAVENAKRNEAETSARMIIACGARLTGRASQWYETVTSSDMRDNSQNPGIMMVDELPNTLAGWKYFTRLFLAAFTSSTETFDLRDQLKKFVWNPDKDAIKAHILTMTTI